MRAARLHLEVASISYKSMRWVWDITASKALFVLSASIVFTRKAPGVKQETEAVLQRRALFARRQR
jgi:hypothetical protein